MWLLAFSLQAQTRGLNAELLAQQLDNILLGLCTGALAGMTNRWRFASMVLLFTLGLILIFDAAGYIIFERHIRLHELIQVTELRHLKSSLVALIDYRLAANLLLLTMLLWAASRPGLIFLNRVLDLTNPHRQRQLYALMLVYLALNIITPVISSQPLWRGNVYSSLMTDAFQHFKKQTYPGELAISTDITSLRFGKPRNTTALDRELGNIGEQLRSSATPLNIILVVLESVGADEIFRDGGMDTAITPTLHKLYQQSVAFDAVYASMTTSEIANTELITGGFAPTWEDLPELLEQPYTGQTLAQTINRRGYVSALFSAADTSYRNFSNIAPPGDYQTIYDISRVPKAEQQALRLNSWGADDRKIFHKATQWMARQAQNKQPFFLHLISNSPHHPYSLPSDFSPPFKVPRDQREAYLNSLAYVDSALGEMVSWLEREKLKDNTLLVITADHPDHSNTLKEQDIRVFALLSGPPAINKTLRSDRPATLADLSATLLAATGGISTQMQGHNLLAENFPDRIIYFRNSPMPNIWGLRDAQWKFIRQGLDQKPQLYNLEEDPQERINIAEHFPDQLKVYQNLAQAWFLKKNRAFKSRLAKAPTDAKAPFINDDLSQTGPTAIKIGRLYQHDRSPQGRSPILWQEGSLFHPQDPLIARIYWLNAKQKQQATFIWQSPGGQQYARSHPINHMEIMTRDRLAAPPPLQKGEWQLRVVENGQTLLKANFLVAENAPAFAAQGSAAKRPLNPLLDFIINHTNRPPGVVWSTDSLTVGTSWYLGLKKPSYTLVLIAPDDVEIRVPLTIPPQKDNLVTVLNPPAAVPVGLWRARVMDGNLILGETRFEVQEPPK